MIFGISILQSPRNVYSDLCILQKILKLRHIIILLCEGCQIFHDHTKVQFEYLIKLISKVLNHYQITVWEVFAHFSHIASDFTKKTIRRH
jgi:hypothetical protein